MTGPTSRFMAAFKKHMLAKPATGASRGDGCELPERRRKPGTREPLFPRMHTHDYLILLAVLLYTVILFSNAMHNSFLDWDDNAYVRDNVDIRSLRPSNIQAMFTHYYVRNWQPLTILSYALEYSLTGAKSPVLYHVDNLILHLLNLVLIFVLVVLLTKDRWIAGLTILLFSVHPLRVESVSWVAERKDVLYSSFFLLSLIFYHWYLRRGLDLQEDGRYGHDPDESASRRFYILAAVSLLLSALAKSAAVVLPVLLILFDFYYKRRIDTRSLIEKIPFFALALFVGIMAVKSQEEVIRDFPEVGFINRLFIVNFNFVRYLALSVFPVHLSALHPYPEMSGGRLPLLYYLSPLMNISLVATLIWSLKFTRDLVFGFLFFLITIALVIQIIPVGVAVISERYTYMPHVGLFFVASIYLRKLWRMESIHPLLGKVAAGGVLLAAVTGFSCTTYQRNTVWRDGMSLWTDVIEKYPDSTYSGYYERGRIEQANKDIESALRDYDRAIHNNPRDYKAFINRGIIKQERGLIDSALSDYNTAISINPYYNIVYNNRGALRRIKNDLMGALDDFSRAVRMNPNQIEAQYNCGTVKFELSDFRGAIPHFDKVLSLQDNYLMSYEYRAASKYNSGDTAGACADWRRGAELGNEPCIANLNANCR